MTSRSIACMKAIVQSIGLLCIASITFAQDLKPVSVVGVYNEKISYAEISTHYAVAQGWNSIAIFDIQDPSSPTLVSRVPFNKIVLGFALKWPVLYVALKSETDSLQIVDLSDVSHPKVIQSLADIEEELFYPRVKGHFLLIDSQGGKVRHYQVYDISDALFPKLKLDGHWYYGRGDYSNGSQYATDGHFLFYATEDREHETERLPIKIVDATTSPTTVATLSIDSEQQFTFRNRDGKLIAAVVPAIDDLSKKPQETQPINSVALADLSSPPKLYVYPSDKIGQEGQAKAALPDGLHINFSDDGVAVEQYIDGQAIRKSILGENGGAKQIRISGDRGYLVDGKDGLQVLDVSDPGQVICLARREGYANPIIRAIDGNTLFLEEDSGIQIIDFANPETPVALGRMSSRGPISLQGKYAYCAAGEYGLQISNISDLSNPQIVGAYKTEFPAGDLVCVGELVYLAAKDLLTIDVSNPELPTLTAKTPVLFQELTESEDGELQRDYTDFLARNGSPIMKRLGPAIYWIQRLNISDLGGDLNIGHLCAVFDISKPQNAGQVGYFAASPKNPRYPDGDEINIGVSTSQASAPAQYPGWFLGVSTHYSRTGSWDVTERQSLEIYDLTDPFAPKLLHEFEGLDYDHTISTLAQEKIYIANGEGGLLILQPEK